MRSEHKSRHAWLLGCCAFLVLQLLLLPSRAWAQSSPEAACLPGGYTVGFFNGVWNTQLQALNGLYALRTLESNRYKNEPVDYELFYNHTGSTVGASGLQDIAEVFMQRTQEVDDSGKLAKHWYLLWETLSGDPLGLWEETIAGFPKAKNVLDALYESLVSKSVAAVSAMLNDPPTQADMTAHRNRLNVLAAGKRKLLLVAHSQGNLFVNLAYDHVRTKAPASAVQVVHIAPASPTLRGGHVLAGIDLVINGLRAQGLHSVPPVNLNLAASASDASGHTLIGTYLDSSRPGRDTVQGLMRAAMDAMVTPAGAPTECGEEYRAHFMRLLAGDYAGEAPPTGNHESQRCNAQVTQDNLSTQGQSMFATDRAVSLHVSSTDAGVSVLAELQPQQDVHLTLGTAAWQADGGFSNLSVMPDGSGAGKVAYCGRDEQTPAGALSGPVQLGLEVSRLMREMRSTFSVNGCLMRRPGEVFGKLNDAPLPVAFGEGVILIGKTPYALTIGNKSENVSIMPKWFSPEGMLRFTASSRDNDHLDMLIVKGKGVARYVQVMNDGSSVHCAQEFH